jgi:hypothetical protein
VAVTRWVHGVSQDVLRVAFREYFGVADEHVEILIVLYGRPGEWTPIKRLQVLLDSHRPPKRQAVYERISVLRDAMEAESLLSGGQLDEFGQGYALSEVGYAECAQALRALVEALLRAGPQICLPPADGDDGSPISVIAVNELEAAVEGLEATRPPAISEPLRPRARLAS